MARRTAGMTYLELICIEQRDQIQFPIYALRMTPKKGNSRTSSKRWWLCGTHLRQQLNKPKFPRFAAVADGVKEACAQGRLLDVRSIDHVACRECTRIYR